MNLSVSSADHDTVTVVRVEGEIDVYTAPLLREALDKEIASGRIDLVVDLSEVTFMDSTALGVLVGRLKLVRVRSGTLRVVVTHDRVRRVFGITGLDKVFTLFESLESALGAAGAQA